MADEPPQSEPAAAEPEAPPEAADAAAGLAAGVGLAFGGATENLQDVINVVFDVVQKQQVDMNRAWLCAEVAGPHEPGMALCRSSRST